ncbi:excinuclease ABC subunit UvrA [Patescibacteria group bacterium]
MADEFIEVRGARQHNLQDLNIKIPKNKLVVITGLSGSGKSSLAFDTIYAEGQRRYVESLSAYARQFLGIMDKPDVDQILGLSPSISIDQKSAGGSPRSTVGTITEIYDYLRLLYARIGIPHCAECGKKITKQTPERIANKIYDSFSEGTRVIILSPLVEGRKGEHEHTFDKIKKAGFVRVRVDGIISDLSEVPSLDKQKKHSIEIVIDRMTIKKSDRIRLSEAVENALKWGEGRFYIYDISKKQDKVFSELFACSDCGISLPEIAPRSFSFNSPYGACEDCTGLGIKLSVDPELVIPNQRLTLAEGAIRPWVKMASRLTWNEKILRAVARENKFSVDDEVEDLSEKILQIVLYGTGLKEYNIDGYLTKYEGVIPNLERRYKETDSDFIRNEIEKYMTEKICPTCGGKRLKQEFLSVLIEGKSISEICEIPINKVQKVFIELKLNQTEKQIAKQILLEINRRLKFLDDVGLEYLTLDRRTSTLAGGEAQRIRLATQIGSGLSGVIYILDEPTIGLHSRDNLRLITTLKALRDLGNTVIVVEHDEDMMKAADHIIDIGPGAGKHGGKVVFEGTYLKIKKSHTSTGRFLIGKEKIEIPKARRKGNNKILEIKKASAFNLKDIDIQIPLGTFTCFTGVSGSGKSSLVFEVLSKALRNKFHRAQLVPGEHQEIVGTENLNKVIVIDQSPIGRTPRSNPATYTGVFTKIRELFAQSPEAKIRGYNAGRFSFNVRGGRCETCGGDGVKKIEMFFLPDVYVPCEDCRGKRYNREALDIQYKSKNISNILDMTIEEALKFFNNIPAIKEKLKILNDVGLGYLHLGQPATTLSGGEAQRIKLASELSRRDTGQTLYILDEPTTGLHFADIKKLLTVLVKLVEKGNTVLVIEHNLQVIKTADHLIDLGPEGGESGGEIVGTGTPEDIAKNKKSYTGQYLKKIL